ncbi:hypothetical protein ABZ953_36820 [Streptomyces sp. NPDC046465]|uniref:hypothetical protein n=1 Tax=Streptomyces sp. NPDC046465 TaxID=3155810 RepID=UPI0033DC35BD
MADRRHHRGSFARWLLRQYRLAGHDTDDAEAHIRIVVTAAVALDAGLTPEQATHLAHTLDVTPQQVTAAYSAEMRQRTLDQLLDHPGLAELDTHLDDIARS